MKNSLFFLLIILVLVSCQNVNDVALSEAKAELNAAQATIDSLQAANETGIIHTIYLTTKPDISDEDKAKFIKTVESLGQIEQVKSIEVAERFNVGDEERALKQYNIVLQMRFESLEDLKIYDKDEYHAQVRGQLKDYLAGPPASFDFEL
jgi:2C-methyl-D-erythritol 2,4-cyclodiphosphate synthase